MTYDDVNHLSAKIKPKQQRVNDFLRVSWSSPGREKRVSTGCVVCEIGGAGDGHELNEPQLLSQQRRADRVECGRNGVR